jgi:hypothetical protein
VKLIYGFVGLALLTAGTSAAADCDCAADGRDCVACADACPNHWVCVPRYENLSVEVNEWGTASETICRPRCRIFDCLWECRECNQAGCDDACDASDPLFACFRPRHRKKLMRKTIVQPVAVLRFDAHPQCDPAACCATCCDSPAASGTGTTHRLNGEANTNNADTTIHWLIDGQAGNAQQSVTILPSSELQAPAPISTTPTAAAPDAAPVTGGRQRFRVSDHLFAMPKGNRDVD